MMHSRVAPLPKANRGTKSVQLRSQQQMVVAAVTASWWKPLNGQPGYQPGIAASSLPLGVGPQKGTQGAAG